MATCPTDHPNRNRRVCQSILDAGDGDYYQHFTGVGYEYALWCASCHKKQQQDEEHVALVCIACQEELREEGSWDGLSGRPAIAERPSSLRFSHQSYTVAELQDEVVVDLQPLMHLLTNSWLGVTAKQKWFHLTVDDSGSIKYEPLFDTLDPKLEGELHLTVSPNGLWGALVQTRGQHGIVVNLQTGCVSMQLERDTYHIDVTPFPVAFFIEGGQERIVHATKWNRLDISDPSTGTCLTSRTHSKISEDPPRYDHVLDYFHGRLVVSPNQTWIVDNGWVWGPAGIIEMWDVQHWATNNVWESEDGSTKKNLCWSAYHWDAALCFLDEKTLAVWGYGQDEEWMLPAVRIFDVERGKEIRWFAGPDIEAQTTNPWKKWPYHGLVFDEFLFSFSEKNGSAVWDIVTGERLHFDASFYPTRYHHRAKRWLSLQGPGQFIVSTLEQKRAELTRVTW